MTTRNGSENSSRHNGHGSANGHDKTNGHSRANGNGKTNGHSAFHGARLAPPSDDDAAGADQSVNSALSGFYKLPMESRRAELAAAAHVPLADMRAISAANGLTDEQADKMVENALGILGMPLGVCTNMRLNGCDVLVPMSVEEPSVVAAASHASKLMRAGGGIEAECTPPHMIGQIQVLDVQDIDAARETIADDRDRLIEIANSCDPTLVEHGGGAFDIETRQLDPLGSDDPCGPMLVVHLLVDVRDAMGANAINTMCERLASEIESLTGGRVRLRILSNLADRRLVTVRGCVPFEALEGKGGSTAMELAEGIQEASVFAERDPYRASTHNKGIMNGIDAVLLAFGQDWRAVEAGAHAYAARDGRYTALATWRVDEERGLIGEMTVPMAVGTVGGVARVHPTVQIARRIAGIEHADELAMIVAAVGLAQNLGALRALAAEGIQRGHMRLHARNVAAEAGAEDSEIDAVAAHMAEEGCVRADAARRILREIRA